MIKPKRLKAGDKVAAVTLSWGGPGTFRHQYEAGKRQLEAAFGALGKRLVLAVEETTAPKSERHHESRKRIAGRRGQRHAAARDSNLRRSR